MPDHNLVAALFAKRHVATGSVSIIAPIITATVPPIVSVAIVITTLTVVPVSVTAVRSDAEVKLSKRDFGFGRDSIPSISGGCRESPDCRRDGGDKRQFSDSNLLLCC
jgi:hypothetical protein